MSNIIERPFLVIEIGIPGSDVEERLEVNMGWCFAVHDVINDVGGPL